MTSKCVCLQGRYGFKLLAVDVPTAAGKEQRLFLDGDDKLYTRGGVMSELRDPFLRVRSLTLGASSMHTSDIDFFISSDAESPLGTHQA